MTKEDVKKELERSARLTGKDVFVDAYQIITDQEQEIKRLNEENHELTYRFVKTAQKHAQVDILNKVKVLIFQKDNPYDVPFEAFVGANVFCGYIDELIKEVEND